MSENYYYAVARTAELETRLLDKARIEQLISSPDVDTALKTLSGTIYSEYIDHLEAPENFDKILIDETKKLFEYIDEICPQKEISEIYLLQHDIFNLKVLYRAKLLNKDQSALYSSLGTVPLEELSDALEVENNTKIMPEFTYAINKIRENDVKSPQIIDSILDKAQFYAQLRLAKKSGSRFIEKMIKINLDLTNIRDYLRTINGQKAAFSPIFIKGGLLSDDFFYDTYIEGQPDLKEKLTVTEYYPLVLGVAKFEEKGNMTMLEKLCDEFVTDYIKSKNTVTFGPEKLIAYITAKNNEISTLRMIIISKLNNIPTETIRKRLRNI